MGKGILGPVLDAIPLPSEGKPLIMRDATAVPGVVCEIHGFTPAQLFTRHSFIEMIRSPAGVDACRDCLTRLLDYIRTQRPDVLR